MKSNLFISIRFKTLRYLSSKINQIRFKILNQGLIKNQIAISKQIILNVHKDAYYPFRYFTDFDADMVSEMKSFIKFTKEKKCFFDIGAHYGIFSLVFSSKLDTKAFAFDPSPSAYKILEHHLYLNSKCRIEAFKLAFGDLEGKLKMQSDVSDHLTITKSDILAVDKLVEVDITTIDRFILRRNIRPDVIKIDTEGFELNVLKGGADFLSNYNPMIFLEVHPSLLKNLGYSVEDLIKFLHKLKYKLYDLNLKLIENPASYLNCNIRRIICCKSPE